MLTRLMTDGRVAVHGVYFDVGTANIRPESYSALSVISTILKQHPELRLTIEAHTDNTGSPERNQVLSSARAAAVVEHLTCSGIAPERLHAVGRGAEQPIVANDSPANRQRNRRIELVIHQPLEAQ